MIVEKIINHIREQLESKLFDKNEFVITGSRNHAPSQGYVIIGDTIRIKLEIVNLLEKIIDEIIKSYHILEQPHQKFTQHVHRKL